MIFFSCAACPASPVIHIHVQPSKLSKNKEPMNIELYNRAQPAAAGGGRLFNCVFVSLYFLTPD